jgi:hypothetical protein
MAASPSPHKIALACFIAFFVLTFAVIGVLLSLGGKPVPPSDSTSASNGPVSD